MKYVVISPVRNEGKHFGRTVASIVAQKVRPAEWIIVDDGSDDNTPHIAQKAAADHAWIRVVKRRNRGHRKPGSGVVEAFYDGYNQLHETNWDVLVKLDGDLEFDSEYFRRLLEVFRAESSLGIAGGDVFHYQADKFVIESKDDPAFHVRGAVKTYRRDCWNAIGGLLPLTGWDTLDEVKANQLGWRTRRVAELQLLHLKPTGAADGTWRNAFKNGQGSFISGYHPLFILLRAARRFLQKPGLVEPAGLVSGYFASYFSRVERVNDKSLVRFLRTQQLRRIFGLSSMWR